MLSLLSCITAFQTLMKGLSVFHVFVVCYQIYIHLYIYCYLYYHLEVFSYIVSPLVLNGTKWCIKWTNFFLQKLKSLRLLMILTRDKNLVTNFRSFKKLIFDATIAQTVYCQEEMVNVIFKLGAYCLFVDCHQKCFNDLMI